MDAQITPATRLWWPSPAKLNLFLHINGRYPNGYHQLQSIFQILDYGDELAFEINDSGNISLATPIVGVADEDNLIVKAARLLQTAAAHSNSANKYGCHIYLRKRLPMGGGIGGGSSNAATTLVALNHLWQLNLPLAELARMGLKLGADVPIFVEGHSAFAEGVGEQLQPCNLAQLHYLVVFPDCHVSTAEIFQHPDLPRDTAKISAADYQFANTRNDCQNLVCQLYPNVANTLQWLLEYAPSRMTGTGSCVFAMFDQLAQAEKVQKLLPEGSISFIASGLNQSPLHQMLRSQSD